MTLTMISSAKKAGTTMGGTNHDADVPELVVPGKGSKASAPSSRRAVAAAWSFA